MEDCLQGMLSKVTVHGYTSNETRSVLLWNVYFNEKHERTIVNVSLICYHSSPHGIDDGRLPLHQINLE